MTSSFRSRTRTLPAIVALIAAVAIVLAGCGSGGSGSDDGSSASSGDWPRTFTNADGTTTEIPAKPENILSTSVSVTGTLLAIGAPVTTSATDANGDFFPQWADRAQEVGVEKAWPAGAPKIEKAIAADPDLIVVASTGQDAMVDNVADLKEIAPTIVVDYGSQDWQDLAVQLGKATGQESQAKDAIGDFDELVADTKSAITVPEGKADIVSYNGPGATNPIGRADGPHGALLTALGFTIEDPNPAWHKQPKARKDFVFADYEHLTELTAGTTFVLSADTAKARSGFGSDKVLANLPSVKNHQVYGLGANSFRMDKYSATEIVKGVRAEFGK